MSEIDIDRLVFDRRPAEDELDVFEVRDADEGEQTVYACVALCRRGWREDWPALGGTRWLQAKPGEPATTPAMARREAAALALAMFMKNNLLRKAELRLRDRGRQLFGWQGGKGVIWTPWDGGGADGNRRHLTPRRLMAYGRLLEFLGGTFIGSQDAGVSGSELRWIERASSYTIGNGCKRSTGEGTAYGVWSGMRTVLDVLGRAVDGPQKLTGVPVLICGLGKVGFPLLQLAHADGALVSLWEPALRSTADADLRAFFEKSRDSGGAVDETHLETLRGLRSRIFTSDREAMETVTSSARGVHFVAPAGSRVEWLTETLDGRARFEILAARADAAQCIVLGPANDQLPLGGHERDLREPALRRLAASGILFVPDPVVSPGGVIAVSHELTAEWRAERVNDDAVRIVDQSVRMLFAAADRPTDTASLYQAFEQLALESAP